MMSAGAATATATAAAAAMSLVELFARRSAALRMKSAIPTAMTTGRTSAAAAAAAAAAAVASTSAQPASAAAVALGCGSVKARRRFLATAPNAPASARRGRQGEQRVLVTGAEGQIGVELVPLMRSTYGADNVLATDLHPSLPGTVALDVTDMDRMQHLVQQHKATVVVHLASLLSAVGEMKPQLALKINNAGLENVLEVARRNHDGTGRPLKVFSPSSIAAFGASTPKDSTPNLTVMRPTTMYGVTKVFGELLGDYYATKYGVDYRSLRYPGIVSAGAQPGGGTTDYAVDIYHQALTKGHYECFIQEDTYLPMMYMDDCLKATMQLLEADRRRLTHTTYNIGAMSVCPSEVAAAIQRHIPEFRVTYAPDFREAIAQSWPRSIDDSAARQDWGWLPDIDIERMTDTMLSVLRRKYSADTVRAAAAAGATEV